MVIMHKTAIVTGASGQLGNIFIEALKNDGFYIYAIDIDIEGSSDTETIKHVELDITNEDHIDNLFKMIKSVDVLINNAGIGVFTPFESRTASEFKKVMEVNLLGTFLMSQSVIRIMKNNNKGKIVNIASIYGSRSSDERIYGDSGRNNSEVYSATKAGVINLTKYMAAHFGKYNIQTNSISPGGIFNNQTSEFIDNYEYKTPMHRMGNEQDLISTLRYLISDESNYTNGQDIAVDGGFLSW
jgi:3-oxoacyl-[acyl-carrier protein] reductase